MKFLCSEGWIAKEAARLAYRIRPFSPLTVDHAVDPVTGALLVSTPSVALTIPAEWRMWEAETPESVREFLMTRVILPQLLPHGY